MIKAVKMKKIYLICLVFIGILFGCDTSKFSETPDSKFIGKWEYESDNIYNGIIINITKDKENEFTGKVIQINKNKLVKLFIDSNFTLISNITRNSNFEFAVIENRIAKELFSLYKIESTNKYKAQFINDNLIGLAQGESDPKNSTIKLRKIK